MANSCERRALYPGSFDPATNGHRWVMSKVSEQYDKGFVAIGINSDKNQGRFPIPEREQMLREIVAEEFPNLVVTKFMGLYLVDFAEMMGAKYVVRGTRNGNDFDAESDLKHINTTINPNIEITIFIPPKELLQVSSSSVMGLMGFEGWEREVKKMVPQPVFERLKLLQFERDKKSLEARWQSLWESLMAKGDSKAVFEDIIGRYTEASRAYHTLSHLKTCLNELELVRDLADDPKAMETAIWFHDAIYESNNKGQANLKHDDEGKSADFAKEVLVEKMGLDKEFADKVASIILATKHSSVPQDKDAKLMVDIDLAIFGRSERLYNIYEKDIHREFYWVPAESFNNGRIRILEQFLKRDRIYSTDFFQERYGEQAKKNLTGELSKIRRKEVVFKSNPPSK